MFAVIAVSLVLVIGGSYANCPDGCKCGRDNISANCSSHDQSRVPGGHWPDIENLWLDRIGITELNEDSFTAFPNVKSLYLLELPINELNLNVLVKMQKLKFLRCESDTLRKVIPLDGYQELPELTCISIVSESLTDISGNCLNGIPHANRLQVTASNFTLPGNRSFVKSDSLQYLHLSRTNGSQISSETFSGNPNLTLLELNDASVPATKDYFWSLPNLQELHLNRNPITEVQTRILTSDGWSVYLDETPLHTLSIEAVESASYVSFYDTPLSCSCNYEPIYKEDNITIGATCYKNDVRHICHFEEECCGGSYQEI